MSILSVSSCAVYAHGVTGYHHGNLRTALLEAAADHVAREGADGLSLRALAAAAGVSHGAPAHHFGDRRGLFTALAAQGFSLLADALEATEADFLEQAAAYVDLARSKPGHFAVMFRPALVNEKDPEFVAARTRAGTLLSAGAGHLPADDPVALRTAAFSLAHGFATLLLAGALGDEAAAADPLDLVRRMGRLLAAS